MSAGDVFGIHAPFWQIFYRSAIVYVAVVVGIRLTGRRQLGQMTPFDLVLILLNANAVQNAMVGSDVSIFMRRPTRRSLMQWDAMPRPSAK